MQRRDANAYLRRNACTFSYRLTIFWSNCSGSEYSINFEFKKSIRLFSSCYVLRRTAQGCWRSYSLCIYTSYTTRKSPECVCCMFFYLLVCLHIYLGYGLFSYTVSSSNCITSNGRMICDWWWIRKDLVGSNSIRVEVLKLSFLNLSSRSLIKGTFLKIIAPSRLYLGFRWRDFFWTSYLTVSALALQTMQVCDVYN